MSEKGFNKFLNILLSIIIIFIILVLGFIGYDYFFKKYKNAVDAANEIAEIDKFIEEHSKKSTEDKENKEDPNKKDPNKNEEDVDADNYSEQNENSSGNEYEEDETYGLTYRGYGVLGKIDLPTLGLKYPILETLTDANAIDVSVAMQYGVGLNKVGNTIIMGHNYRNGTFFGSNKNLNVGDKVYITDLTGKEVEYTIYNKYLTPQEDFSYADRNTNGKREVTLVTCHTDNRYRLIIFAVEN